MRFKAGKLAGSGKQAVARKAVARKAASLAMLVMAAALSGCSTIRDHRGFLIDQALVDSVLPGVDNKNSVERTLGRPTLASQFGDQTWYYIATDTRQVAFRRPQTHEQTILRVRFDAKGNVLAVDKAGMERVVRMAPDKDLTPTLGKKRTLLEDLFGNIGTVGAGGMGGQQGSTQGRGPNGS